MTRKEALKILCCELFSSIDKEKAYQKWRTINDCAVLAIEEYNKRGKINSEEASKLMVSNKNYESLAYLLYTCPLDIEEAIYDCWKGITDEKISLIEDVICYRKGLY